MRIILILLLLSSVANCADFSKKLPSHPRFKVKKNPIWGLQGKNIYKYIYVSKMPLQDFKIKIWGKDVFQVYIDTFPAKVYRESPTICARDSNSYLIERKCDGTVFINGKEYTQLKLAQPIISTKKRMPLIKLRIHCARMLTKWYCKKEKQND